MRTHLSVFLSLRVLLLFTLSSLVLASPTASIDERPRHIAIRQTASTLLNQAQACAQYSTIANLSVIGANSSYRSAFLQASPVGTLQNSAILNKAISDNTMLSADAALNQACGNSTATAITEAANNFTKGVIGQFTFTGNPSAVITSPVIAMVVILCLIVFFPITAL